MVLPPSPPDPEAAEATELAWLRRVTRVLALAQRQLVVMIRSTSKAGVRPLIRTLEDEGVALRVSLDPVELLDAPEGATVLLEVRAAHAAWLNVNRTVITERGLRLIAWASEADASALANEAPDFWDWISHLVDAPGGPHGFARRGLARATSTIVWFGDNLDGLRRAVGREGPRQTIAASANYDALVEAAGTPDWLMVEGLAQPEQLARLRWAIAEARREAPTVLVHPTLAVLPGWCVVHDRPLDWSMARDRLVALEVDDATRIAALLDFEPEAIDRAQLLMTAPTTEREAVLAAADPGVALLAANAGEPELRDALSWRGNWTISLPVPVDPIERALREPGVNHWLQLSGRASQRQQWAVAQRWAAVAHELARTPEQREAAENQRRYALAQRSAPHVFISHAAASSDEVTAIGEFANRLRADGVLVEVARGTEPVDQVGLSWLASQVFEADAFVGVCSPRWLARFVDTEDFARLEARVPLWSIAHQLELVVLDGEVPTELPALLRDRLVSELPEDYERLYARLTGQGVDAVPDLARLRPLSGWTRAGLAEDDTRAARIRPHNLPPRPAIFVDRTRELEAIAAGLSEDKIVAVVGLGGVGKTALAIEYAYRHLHEYDRVAWIDLAGRSFEDAYTELISVMLVLGDDPSDRVREALSRPGALLVLDDVQVADPRWADFGTHVLLTSRRRDLGLAARTLELAPLAPDDSLLLLLGPEPPERSRRAAAELVERLDGLPLALALARARLEQGRALDGLVDELREPRSVLGLDARVGDLLDGLDPDDDDDALARELALVAACLADAPVPDQVLSAALTQLREDAPSEAALTRAHARLHDVGLTATGGELRLHSVLARALWIQAETTHIEAAVHGVATALREIDDLARATELLPSLRPHAREIVTRMGDPATLDEIVVACQLAEERRFFGAVAEALQITGRALERVHDDEHRAGLLVAVGRFQRELRQLNEAAASYTAAIELFEGAHGTSAHPDVAVAQHGLALVYQDQGDLARASELLERSIAVERDLRETEAHPKVVVKLRDLARVLRDRGELTQARALLERTLELAVDAAGTWVDKEVVGTLHTLAKVEWTLGALDSAERRLERALGLWRELAGDGPHPNLATILQELGHVLLARGDLDAAGDTLERALVIGQEVYGGDESPEVAFMMQSLAQVYSSRGELSRSRELFERAVMILTRLGADSSPGFAQTLHGLGVLLAAEGKLDEAIETFGRALAIIEAHVGTRDHPKYASTELALALAKLQAGDRTAETMFVHAVQALRRYAPNHPTLTQLRELLGGQLDQLVAPDPTPEED